MSKIAIIGSGFSGLSAAAYLSAAGHEVHIFEKNESVGGRARQLKTASGYVFDMGPSWYWMPDVFERFFEDFGYSSSDFYDLVPLDPGFEVVFKENEHLKIPREFSEICRVFESVEQGSSLSLEKFMEEAQYKYEQGMKKLVYMPGLSVMEFADMDLIKGVMRLQVFSSLSDHVRKHFVNSKLIALMEFPVLFLGAMPQDTPAMYSLMNYAALKLGTWYPIGGFGKVVEAIVKIAEQHNAIFHFNFPVQKIITNRNLVKGVLVNEELLQFDAVVASADYQYVEEQLLPADYRNYRESYWDKKTFAPSCLIFYLGISKKIAALEHHTLFFDEDLEDHAKQIYKDPKWPDKPLFYTCCPSKTDAGVAPPGHENLFLLMPVAPGLDDTDSIREHYFSIMISRLEKHAGENIADHIDYKKSYCIRDFVSDYHSYKGNAYGLANTLMQTALMKPKIVNKKLKNLFYTGQLTVPGPGVPPSIISGKIVSDQLITYLKNINYEAAV